MSETDIVHAILAALAGDKSLVAWRNNSGQDRKRHFRYGLGVGSADIIAILSPSGRFVGLEVKTPKGDVEKHQLDWGKTVCFMGGYYAVVRSVQEALAHIREAKIGRT